MGLEITGLATSPKFWAYDRGPGAAFLPPEEHLPNDRWDRPERIRCLFDIVERFASSLPQVRRIDFEALPVTKIASFHAPTYLRPLGLAGGKEVPLTEAAEVALHAAGAGVELVNKIWRGEIRNGYALARPAGHHAGVSRAGGGCILANGVFAALEAKKLGAERIVYIDWDAHHGNGEQEAFWNDPSVLTISVHQARKFPPCTGGLDARGGEAAFGSHINIPVPPGSGGGVYRRVFTEVIEPATEIFHPDFVIVSSGLDANYIDPSARLSLHSGDFGWMTGRTMDLATRFAQGRLLLTHEGGYSLSYIPLCFLRIMEKLSGQQEVVPDKYVERWGEDFAAAVSFEAKEVITAAAKFLPDVPEPSLLSSQ